MANTRIEIAVVGRTAARTLRAHAQGRVFAVFQRTFYLRFGEDELVCFGPLALRPGPLHALYRGDDRTGWAARGLAPDAGVRIEGGTLRIDTRFSFAFDAADVWTPPLAPRVNGGSLCERLRLLAVAAERRAPGGLGPLLYSHSADPDAPRDRLLDAARPAIVALRAWLDTTLRGNDAAPPVVAALIGLGGGLTPSGDDYLCGVMTALSYFGHRPAAVRLAGVVLPRAAQETNLVSQAYLRCASRGEASAVLFDVLEWLACADHRSLEQRLDAVNAVGHTSGWDCLAGAAAVCEVLAGAC